MSAKKLKPCKKSNELPVKGMNDREWDRFMETVKEVCDESDKKLKEVADLCLKRECNVK
jgi:hypothetical protein